MSTSQSKSERYPVINGTRHDLVAVILNALSKDRGDNLKRAKAAFRGLPDSEMDRLYGQSGLTGRDILKEYEDHVTVVEAAARWVKDRAGVTHKKGRQPTCPHLRARGARR